MFSVTETITHEGKRLLDDVSALLGPDTELRDINTPSDGMIFIGSHYAFPELSLECKRIQSRLLSDYRHFITIAKALLRGQPGAVQQKLDQHDDTIREVIEQTHLVWYPSTGKAYAAVQQAVEEIIDALSCLYDAAEGSVVLRPDTNALIYSPTFQNWRFSDFEQFDILLAPTLLEELDSLKNEHRNPEVREKAQAVIRQIKEYRRRGSLHEGVTVVADRIQLRSIATEPRASDVLPWLDENSSDDRMVASCIEAMRNHSRSVVVLVTADINLQNKAEFARLPYIEPPEGSAG